jgi:putative oxidoreductase
MSRVGASPRAIARTLLAPIVGVAGAEAKLDPGRRPEVVARAGLPQPGLLVLINDAVMVLGGLGVALGIRRRLTALGSMPSLVATAIGGHAFGRESEEPARTMQRSQFLETLGLLGLGLVVLKPSQHRND